MSKVFQGTTTNNVTELTLQNEGGNIGTQTIVWDDTQGTIDQVLGDIPDSWKNGDSSLKQLQIGTSCTSIGEYAFYSCSGFTGSLTIPDSVTTIGNNAFSVCTGFTGSLTIGNSVTSIGNYAFQDTDLITRVISSSVTSIGDYAFAYNFNSSSTTVYVGCPASSFTGSNAFYSNNALTTLYAKDAVANGYTLGAQTFQGASLTIANWDNYPNPIPN